LGLSALLCLRLGLATALLRLLRRLAAALLCLRLGLAAAILCVLRPSPHSRLRLVIARRPDRQRLCLPIVAEAPAEAGASAGVRRCGLHTSEYRSKSREIVSAARCRRDRFWCATRRGCRDLTYNYS